MSLKDKELHQIVGTPSNLYNHFLAFCQKCGIKSTYIFIKDFFF